MPRAIGPILFLAIATHAFAAPDPPVCGDGVIQGSEECDDGGYNGGPGSCCTAWCERTGKTPDLKVSAILTPRRFGTVGGITAYAFGTEVCNVGACWLRWDGRTPDHPVIGQNLFRLKDGRFEQVGQSWVKHGFGAANESGPCGQCSPPNSGHLGVNCSDIYDAGLNGVQGLLGPKSAVDPWTGTFVYPDTRISLQGDVVFKRLQVRNIDLEPTLNLGARYFVEVQFVSPDDPGTLHGNDSVSFREVVVQAAPYNLQLAGFTVPLRPAIDAWAASDPEVLLTRFDGEGLFLLAAKATPLAGGAWHYEYALQNLTSHRAAESFSVPIPPGAAVSNLGFHDVDYHSGEPFDGTDWTPTVSTTSVTWNTQAHAIDPNANALRWGTLYNFRFDVNVPPGTSSAAIGLFRPGTPGSVSARTITPEPCTGAVEGLPCDDGNGCTQADACASGVCGGGAPMVCPTASDPCRDPGTCDPGSGLCSEVPKPEGGACDDGNPCTEEDVCTAGECRGLSGAVPGEVDGSLRLSGSTLTWNPSSGSTSYRVLRGRIADLPVGPADGDEVCLDPVPGTSAIDPEAPGAAGDFWYLVRGESVCGKGPYGAGRTSATCP